MIYQECAIPTLHRNMKFSNKNRRFINVIKETREKKFRHDTKIKLKIKLISSFIIPDNDNNSNEKSTFESIDFYETKLRVPNEKPTFTFVPETSNLH